jgi:hypothetical protein
MRRNLDLEPDAILQSLQLKCPSLTLDAVTGIRGELFRRAIVPAWFHEAVSTYVHIGGRNAEDPVLLDFIASRRPADFSNARQLDMDPAIWMELCVIPSLFQKDLIHCFRMDSDLWALSKNRMSTLVVSMILTEEEGRKPDALVHNIVTAMKANFHITNAEMAQTLNADPQQIAQIRSLIMEPYIQPAWFIEVLVTHGGPASELRAAIIAEERVRGEKIKSAYDIAIGVWTELVLQPIRRGQVDPLPYVRQYRTRNGKMTELIVVRPDLIQIHLDRIYALF